MFFFSEKIFDIFEESGFLRDQENHVNLLFILFFERSGTIVRYQWQHSFTGIFIADICVLANVSSMTAENFATI